MADENMIGLYLSGIIKWMVVFVIRIVNNWIVEKWLYLLFFYYLLFVLVTKIEYLKKN